MIKNQECTMPKKKELEFGLMDVPLSCSMFLEPALYKYRQFIAPVSDDTQKFVHEWNRALVSVLQLPQYSGYLGQMGNKILRGTINSKNFPVKCVDQARDVSLQSLHYALRFSESMNFLREKIGANPDIKFVDLGCGLSPMTAAIQSEYNIKNAYCIDIPEIIDVYSQAAMLVGAPEPRAIKWQDAERMAQSHQLDTIVAMGVFPYIKKDEQLRRLKFINAHFPNCIVEIKFNSNADDAGENVFTAQQLRRLRMETANAHTLETKMIENSLRYLHKFMCAMPDKRYFLAGDRSLFFSR